MGRRPNPEKNEAARLVEAFARVRVRVPADVAHALCLEARSHHSIQERACNGTPMQRDSEREESIERRVRETCAPLKLGVSFGGDPRGFTVRLHAPKGDVWNTWGGAEHGYGIGENV